MKTNIYFLRCGALLKIGKADDVAERMAQLQTGNPTGLQLIAVLHGVLPSAERLYHRFFTEERVRGEWFTYSKRLKALVAHIQGGAVPTTVHALQYYTALPELKWKPDDQLRFGRICSETRKAMKQPDWDAVRWAARGEMHGRAIAIVQKRLQ